MSFSSKLVNFLLSNILVFLFEVLSFNSFIIFILYVLECFLSQLITLIVITYSLFLRDVSPFKVTVSMGVFVS